MAEATSDAMLPLIERVGDRLRAARLSAGLSLEDIAEKTRIPLRHLDALERSDYAALPSFTYAAGFVRAFARALGADEVSLARDLRVELGRETSAMAMVQADDIADPARVPPRWLAMTTAIVLVAFAGGYGLWRSAVLTPDEPATVTPPAPKAIAKPKPAAAPTAPSGPIVLTARQDVWLRIYDRTNKVLFEGIKKAGESYTVPADADTPMIRLGAPENLDVSIGGAAIAPLGPPARTVKDVVLTVGALTAAKTPAAGQAPLPPPQQSDAPARP